MSANPRRPRTGSSELILPAGSDRGTRKQVVVDTVRASGLTPRQAALSVGVSASTFYEWADADPVFRGQIAEAEAIFERRMAAVIVTNAVSLRSFRAALAFLERRFPDRWGDRTRLDLTLERPSREDEIDAALTDEELQRRLRELAAEVASRFGDAP